VEDDMSSAPVYDVEATEWVTDGCRLTATGVAPVIPLQLAEPSTPIAPVRQRPRRAGSRGPRYASAPLPATPDTLHLTRRGELLVRRVTAALVVLAVAGVLIALAVGVVGLLHPAAQSSRTVIVQPGQSLWQIAEEHNSDGDVRDQIERIRSLNGLAGADVQAGQRLIVPSG
jgi:hypothetical protein